MRMIIDESAIARVNELRELQNKPGLMLRIRVDGGGCSGFQYKMLLTDEAATDQDIVFNDHVITDDISLNFLKDAVIKFENGMIGSGFIIDNPNAVSGCGCGTSFAVKQ